jgi:hypothetical protein
MRAYTSCTWFSQPGIISVDIITPPEMKPMARKKVKESKPVIATELEVKSVRLELSPEMHRRFRIEAAKEGQSMAALAKRLVEDWLSKRKNH